MLSGVYSRQREELWCVPVVRDTTAGSKSVKGQSNSCPKGIKGLD